MSDVPIKEWKFDNSTLNYSSHGIIKRQLYYRVFRAIWHTPDKGKLVVAVRENFVREDYTEKQQLEELERLRQLQHPHIVPLLKGLLSDACNVIILEYPTGGFLDEYLRSQRENASEMPIQKVYRWSFCIASAMQFLRQHNFIHRGINKENVIVSGRDVLQVFDLRLAEPHRHMACKEDVVNLAHLMLDLVTLGRNAVLGDVVLSEGYQCPAHLKQVIERCLCRATCMNFDEMFSFLTKEQTEDVSTTPAEIIARGPDAIAAYREAAQTGVQTVRQTRLMLVGQARVGKTSLKKNIMREKFDINEGVTDGITLHSVCSIDVQHATAWRPRNDNQDCCSLQDQYQQTITQHIARSLQCSKDTMQTEVGLSNRQQQTHATQQQAMDPEPQTSQSSKRTSNDDVTGSQKKIKTDNATSSTDNQSGVVNNLTQMITVPEEIYEGVLSRMTDDGNGKDEEETDDITLSIWDFAGHELYYTTHQVFLSRRAVFLVVFNLSGDMQERAFVDHQGDYEIYQLELTRLEFLDFWMRSIFTFAANHRPDASSGVAEEEDVEQLSPPIFIVGTHKNSLGNSLKERKQLIKKKFDTIRRFIRDKCYRKHIVSRFYAIENSLQDDEDKEVVNLRNHIEHVASNEPYMEDEIPLRWLLFQQAVKDAVNSGHFCMTLEEVKKLPGAKDTSDDELTTLLQFYHDLGHIIYIGDCSPALRNLVILDPKWLIDVFKAVINVVDWDDRRGVDIDAWTRLEDEGIIEEKLIKRMWRDIVGTGQEADARKIALLDLMEKFDLLCEKTTSKQASNNNKAGRLFYIPSRLQPLPVADNSSSNLSGSKSSSTVFFIDFQEFLPDGIFHRILARSARWSQEQGGLEPQLHYRHAMFYADATHEFELEMIPHREAKIKVTISCAKLAGTKCKSSGQKSSPEATMKVKRFLLDTLAELKATWARGLQYKLCVACPCTTAQPLHYLDLNQCLKEDLVPCCKSHRVNTRKIQIQLGGKKAKPEDKHTQATDAILSDQFLMEMSEKMDERWEYLATSQLGFTRENLVHIKHDNFTMVTQIHAMLVSWRQQQSRHDVTGVVEDLYKALVECGRQDLAEMCSCLLE